jgi:hypothetical protein
MVAAAATAAAAAGCVIGAPWTAHGVQHGDCEFLGLPRRISFVHKKRILQLKFNVVMVAYVYRC